MAPRPKHTARSRRRSRRQEERTVVTAAAERGETLEERVASVLAAREERAILDGVAVAPSPERAALEAVREALEVAEAPSPAPELADMGECAECEHGFDMHEPDNGACSMDGCSCESYTSASAASVEAEDLTVVSDGVAVARIETRMEGDVCVLSLAPLEGQESVDGTLERLRLHLQNFALAEVVEEIPSPSGPQAVVAPAPDGGIPGELRWVANMVPEGALTDDGRAMAPGSITWRELPLTLMAMVETTEGGHVGAEVAGRIDEIFRDGNMIKGSGVFAQTDYGSLIASLAAGEAVDAELLARVQSVVLVDSEGALVASLVADQTLRGISVDLAIHQYEVGPKSDYFDADGNWLAERPQKAEGEEEPSLLDLLYGEDEDPIFVVTEAVIGAVTVCPFQAFADATIALSASLVAGASPALWTSTQQSGVVVTRHARVAQETFETALEVVAEPVGEVLTASAAGLAPEAPPSEWFNAPELSELTPLTIDDDGRIFGHAAPWDTCHIGIPGVCTTAPQTETNYAYFLLKEVLCEDGERVPCGTITLGIGHADRGLGRAAAAAHYDNTGLAVADVNVGEDEFGIWVAGAVRPGIDSERARELRGAVLSGDWRTVNGNLELVALLAVNVPGFPVPRARALVAAAADGSTEVLALVAAGIHIGTVAEGTAALSPQPTPLQLQKIQALGHVASGRIAELLARAEAAEVSHEHEGGSIEGGFIYCSHEGCAARAPITDGEAAVWIWTDEPVALEFTKGAVSKDELRNAAGFES